MSKIKDVTGLILAGGRSERFGENKAFAKFWGTSILSRVLKVTSSLFEDLLIVTNTPQDYASYGIPVVADSEPYKGPLGGIVTGFQHSTNDKIFVVACDMPMLDSYWIQQVIEKGRHCDAAIPIHETQPEYLMALYSRNLLGRMRCCLSENQLSLKEFCRKLTNIVWVPIVGDSCFDINTRKDLESLVHLNFFSILKNHFHSEEKWIVLKRPLSAREIFLSLFEDKTLGEKFLKSIRFAVNYEYVPPETVVHNKDEVAFIPPVSGG